MIEDSRLCSSFHGASQALGRAVADAGLARTEERARLTRMAGQDRADWVDNELREAGIEPGDASLYPDPHPAHAGPDGPPA